MPSQTRLPPLAPGWPLLANAADLLRDPLAFFLRCYQQIGPIFRVRGGGREYTVLAGPEANAFFVRAADSCFESRPVYQPYIDDLHSPRVLVAMDGPEHRQYRKLLKPAFSRESIGPRLASMIEAVKQAAVAWQPGQIVAVPGTMQYLVAQVCGIALASQPIDGHFKAASTFAHIMLGAGVGGYPGFMRALPHYRLARRRMLGFLRGILAARRHSARPTANPDLVDTLLAQSKANGAALTDDDILAGLHMPYTNSLVYVGALCGFALYFLLKNPAALGHVIEEVDALFADGVPSIHLLRRARWLRAAVLETQRLQPIAISTPRRVTRPFEFDGYRVQPGTITLIATAVCHYLPEFFPEPHQFDAARHLPPRSEHRQSRAFVPFGLDAHACLAAGLVETVVMATLAALLHTVRLELHPPEYGLGLRVAPFPAPEPGFRVRVAAQRVPVPWAAGPSPRERLALFAADLPELDPEVLEAALNEAQARRFAADTEIIRQGDPADGFYVIGRGQVEVIKADPDSGQRSVARLGEGDYFGEIGLLHGVPRTASVRAVTDTEITVLDRQAFMRLVAELDLVSAEISQVMQRRMVSTALVTALPHLDRRAVAGLLADLQLSVYQPGDVIASQGQAISDLGVITAGTVNVELAEAQAPSSLGPASALSRPGQAAFDATYWAAGQSAVHVMWLPLARLPEPPTAQ
jgi:cytochrome P450/CRP-like cAMP-binding protein